MDGNQLKAQIVLEGLKIEEFLSRLIITNLYRLGILIYHYS